MVDNPQTVNDFSEIYLLQGFDFYVDKYLFLSSVLCQTNPVHTPKNELTN